MHRLPINTTLGKLQLLEVYHYFDGPKLFSCSNTAGQRFIALWLGDEEGSDRWIYVPVSHTRFMLARSGGISLRTLCNTPEDGWIWLITLPLDSTEPSSVQPIFPEQLPPDDFPAEDAFLSLETQTLPPIEETISLRAERTRSEILDLALKPQSERRNEIAARTLGVALVNTQDLLEAIVYSRAGYKSRRGRPPLHLRQSSELTAVGVFPSSFGMRLESKVQADMFGETSLRPALEKLIALVSSGMERETLKSLLSELGGRVAARFAVLLNSLAQTNTDLKATWASPKSPTEPRSFSVAWREAQRTVDIILTTIDEFTETFKIRCRLDGIDLYTKAFDLVNLESNERLTGQILDSLIEAARVAAARVPAEYVATIEQRQEIITVTGETKEKYRLVTLEEV